MNNSQHCPGHEDENKKSVTLENLLNIDNGKVLERFKLHQQKKLDLASDGLHALQRLWTSWGHDECATCIHCTLRG
jgi:hypothetical protein